MSYTNAATASCNQSLPQPEVSKAQLEIDKKQIYKYVI